MGEGAPPSKKSRIEEEPDDLNDSFDDDVIYSIPPVSTPQRSLPIKHPAPTTPVLRHASDNSENLTKGQIILLKKQQENAQNTINRLKQEKAAREFQVNKERRELEQRKNQEIAKLRDELNTTKREMTRMHYQIDLNKTNMSNVSNVLDSSTFVAPSQVLNTSMAHAPLPSKKVEMKAPVGFHTKFQNAPRLNHSVFTHPDHKPGVDTFMAMPSGGTSFLHDVSMSSQLPGKFNIFDTKVEKKNFSCQADTTQPLCKVVTRAREQLLETMLNVAIASPEDKFDFNSFETICRVNSTLARDVIHTSPS